MTDMSTPEVAAPQPSSPAPEAPTSSSKSTLAILAFIFGFLAPLVGVVLAIIALVKLRTNGKTGRGLAIAGLIIGIVGTIGYAIVIAMTVLLASAASQNSVNLSVGECTGDIGTGEVSNVATVDCAQPHTFEVYSKFDIAAAPGTNFPGEDAVSTDAETGCAAAFDGFVGKSYEESQYAMSYIAPTGYAWNASNDREVICLIADASGQMTGSAQGTAR